MNREGGCFINYVFIALNAEFWQSVPYHTQGRASGTPFLQEAEGSFDLACVAALDAACSLAAHSEVA